MPCLKNVTTLCCYNFDKYKPILIIFSRNVTEKVKDQKTHYCLTSRKLCFCTTWGNRKSGNCICSLKCCMRFCQQAHKTQNIICHSWTTLHCQNNWLHTLTGHRNAAEHPVVCHPHARRLPSLSQSQSQCQNGSLLFFIKAGVKVNGQYYSDILLISYYLTLPDMTYNVFSGTLNPT